MISLVFVSFSIPALAAAKRSVIACRKTHSTFAKRSAIGKAVYAATKAKKEAAAAANAHREAPRIEVKDADSFAESMTQGMLLHPTQGDLFGIYMAMYFGNPKTDLNGKSFSTVMQILKENPNLEKAHFPEYEINKVVKVYESPESLTKYIRDQSATAAQFRSNVFQIEANLVFWKKLLNLEDPKEPDFFKNHPQKDSPPAEKEAYKKMKVEYRGKQARSQKRFMAYLDRIISQQNRDLLKNDSIAYEQKIEVLFKTLQQLAKHLEKNKKDSRALRQVMVDLVHSTGFNNPVNVALLKNPDALQQIEGLNKILEERDSMAMKLDFEGHFTELLQKLDIEFPSMTGVPESTTAKLISKFQQEILKGKFTNKPVDTIRVRSLSLHEAGFRSCLGGSDCSTRTYFSKAFDPNYHYFTMTDRKHQSSGHLTVVLGEAKDPVTGKLEKVAFADKLQNVPNHLIPEFLQAISLSLLKKGYRLALPERLELPEEARAHGGLSNTSSIMQFVQDHVLNTLKTRLVEFTPHRHQYHFPNLYSRGDKRLAVRLYEPTGLAVDTEIRPGLTYKTYLSNASLNRNTLIAKFLALRESKNPEEILQYITSLNTVKLLEQQNLYSIKKFFEDVGKIIDQTNLPYKVRKTAWLEYYQNAAVWELIFTRFNQFNSSEQATLIQEIRDWSQSTNENRLKFSNKFFSTMAQWSFNYFEKGDFSSIRYLFDHKLIDGNAKDRDGVTLFQKAVAKRNGEIIRYLGSKSGVSLNAKDTADLQGYQMIFKLTAHRDSKDPQELLQFATSFNTVKMLEQNNLYSTKTFHEDLLNLIGRTDLPYKVRKTAWFEHYQNAQDWSTLFQSFHKFSETEMISLIQEVRDWSQSPDPNLQKFSNQFFSTMKQWSFAYVEKDDLNSMVYLLKHKLIDANATNIDSQTLFHKAVARKNFEIVQYLANLPGIRLNEKDSWGKSPAEHFHSALTQITGINVVDRTGKSPISSPPTQVRNAYQLITELLLQHPGIDKDVKNKIGQVALFYPVINENILQILFREPGIDFNTPNANGQSPMMVARNHGQEGSFLLLMKAPGIQPDSRSETHREELIISKVIGAGGVENYLNGKEVPRDEAEILFVMAAASSNISMMEQISKIPGLNINRAIYGDIRGRGDGREDYDAQTAIEVAVNTGSPEAVKFLLSLPNLKIRNFGRVDGLVYDAVYQKNYQILDLLLDLPNRKIGPWPLSRAMKNNDQISINKLLKHPIEGINDMEFDFGKKNILLRILEFYSPEDVRVILGIPGIDINFRREFKRWEDESNSLHYADPAIVVVINRLDYRYKDQVRKEYVEILQILLADPRLDLSIPGESGYTPLMTAVYRNNIELVHQLLQRKDEIAIDAKNSRGWTALRLAKENGRPELVELLIQAGARE